MQLIECDEPRDSLKGNKGHWQKNGQQITAPIKVRKYRVENLAPKSKGASKCKGCMGRGKKKKKFVKKHHHGQRTKRGHRGSRGIALMEKKNSPWGAVVGGKEERRKVGSRQHSSCEPRSKKKEKKQKKGHRPLLC